MTESKPDDLRPIFQAILERLDKMEETIKRLTPLYYPIPYPVSQPVPSLDPYRPTWVVSTITTTTQCSPHTQIYPITASPDTSGVDKRYAVNNNDPNFPIRIYATYTNTTVS